jgi:hypothetical protein
MPILGWHRKEVHEFKANLSYIARPCSIKQKQKESIMNSNPQPLIVVYAYTASPAPPPFSCLVLGPSGSLSLIRLKPAGNAVILYSLLSFCQLKVSNTCCVRHFESLQFLNLGSHFLETIPAYWLFHAITSWALIMVGLVSTASLPILPSIILLDWKYG